MSVALSRRAAALGLLGGMLPLGGRAHAQGAAAGIDPNLVKAAQAEGGGGLVYYGSSSILAVQSDATGFEKTFHIPVAYTQLTSGPLTARVDQEIRAGRIEADVIVTADQAAVERWTKAGQLAKLPPIDFPERTDFAAPVQVVYQGILYNTDAVHADAVPNAWSDLLDHRYFEQIVLGSPRIAPGFSQLYYALLKSPKYGPSYFEQLAKQKPRVVQTPVLVAQSVASGEAAIGMTGLPYEATNILGKNPGAPINYKYLDIVTVAYSFVVVSAKSQKPDAARLFAAWMMTPAGQIAHNGDGRASSVLGDLPGTLKAAKPETIDRADTADKVVADYRELTDLFDRLFG